MDKVKILRLIDEADDIVSALYRQGANKDYKCKSLREKLKAITEEITAPPKSNGDRIRQMTDEELAEWFAPYMHCNRCDKTISSTIKTKAYGCNMNECKKYAIAYMKDENFGNTYYECGGE